MNKKSFTLVEVMISTAILLVLMIFVFNFYNVTRVVYSRNLYQQMLTDGTNIMLGRIIEGKTEPSGVVRLAQAVSYCIGSGVNCAGVSSSELHFWGTDNIERWYSLTNGSTSLLYHHPTAAAPAGADEVIYTAPNGATVTLLFWVPAGNYPAANVGVSVSLTKSTTTGSATTVVNLRNHP